MGGGSDLYKILKLDQVNSTIYDGDGIYPRVKPLPDSDYTLWGIVPGAGNKFMSSFLHHMIFKEVINRFDIPLPPFTPVPIVQDVGRTPPVQNPPPPPNCVLNKISYDSSTPTPKPCFTDPISLDCLHSNRYGNEFVFMDCPRQIIYSGNVPRRPPKSPRFCVNFDPYVSHWYALSNPKIGNINIFYFASKINRYLHNKTTIIIRSSIFNNSAGKLTLGSVVNVRYKEKWEKGILLGKTTLGTYSVILDVKGSKVYKPNVLSKDISAWKGPSDFPFLLIFKPDNNNTSYNITNIWLNPVPQKVLLGAWRKTMYYATDIIKMYIELYTRLVPPYGGHVVRTIAGRPASDARIQDGINI